MRKLHINTIKEIAKFICGYNENLYPIKRNTSDIYFFLLKYGITFNNPASIILDIVADSTNSSKPDNHESVYDLIIKNPNKINTIIEDLTDPRLYSGNERLKILSLNTMNKILKDELYKVEIIQGLPKLIDLNEESKDEDFMKKEFSIGTLENLILDTNIISVLNNRFYEIYNCLKVKSYFAVIILSGSILEGILLGIAQRFPKEYNQCNNAPKDKSGIVYQFHQWTLNNLINVSHELGHIKEDVKTFSHYLRDFRNYIHPHLQVSSQFYPNEDTAKICFQVLKAAISQLNENIK